eukprot:3288537-Alexandrium_andersonii.AAC.1
MSLVDFSVAGKRRSCLSRAAVQGCCAFRCRRASHLDQSQQLDTLAWGRNSVCVCVSACVRACLRA